MATVPDTVALFAGDVIAAVAAIADPRAISNTANATTMPWTKVPRRNSPCFISPPPGTAMELGARANGARSDLADQSEAFPERRLRIAVLTYAVKRTLK
jgi:hypothetical protein